MFARFFVALFINIFSFSAYSQTTPPAVPTQDPLGDTQRLLTLLQARSADELAEELGKSLGNPQAKEALGGQLKPFEKIKPTFSAIAFDREYGGAIRQIIAYQHGLSPAHPFMYFRFVYKRTGSGWQLTHFGFNTEVQLSFPPSFGLF